jgi:hypothetical protein
MIAKLLPCLLRQMDAITICLASIRGTSRGMPGSTPDRIRLSRIRRVSGGGVIGMDHLHYLGNFGRVKTRGVLLRL